jgi:pimeloyl-ACP methyl ester carboxylesterase
VPPGRDDSGRGRRGRLLHDPCRRKAVGPVPPSEPRPSWLTESDLDDYADEFERTGLSGALNRYRNVDRDWEDLAAWDGEPIRQPSLFIGGELDASTTWALRAINHHPQTLPGISSSHIIEGGGHWIQQEHPDRVSRLVIDWLRSLPRGSTAERTETRSA